LAGEAVGDAALGGIAGRIAAFHGRALNSGISGACVGLRGASAVGLRRESLVAAVGATLGDAERLGVRGPRNVVAVDRQRATMPGSAGDERGGHERASRCVRAGRRSVGHRLSLLRGLRSGLLGGRSLAERDALGGRGMAFVKVDMGGRDGARSVRDMPVPGHEAGIVDGSLGADERSKGECHDGQRREAGFE